MKDSFKARTTLAKVKNCYASRILADLKGVLDIDEFDENGKRIEN